MERVLLRDGLHDGTPDAARRTRDEDFHEREFLQTVSVWHFEVQGTVVRAHPHSERLFHTQSHAGRSEAHTHPPIRAFQRGGTSKRGLVAVVLLHPVLLRAWRRVAHR